MKLSRVPYVTATSAAQARLRLSGVSIDVDGKWGSFANRAYNAASDGLRAEIDDMVAALTKGGTVADLAAYREEEKSDTNRRAARAESSLDGWIPISEADRYSSLIAPRFGIDPQVLKDFVRLEAAQVVQGGVRYVNPYSRNGQYRGLYQLNAASWREAQERARRVGVELRDFGSWADPEQNTIAGVAYAVQNIAYLRAAGYQGPITAAVLYAAHNQGAGGFMRALKTGKVLFPAQSKMAIETIKVAAAQNGVTIA